jgi:hypothetical protein
VILDLCSCPNSNSYYKLNRQFSLRFTILTPGVYWTDQAVGIQPFVTEGAACSAPYATTPDVWYSFANTTNEERTTYGDPIKNGSGSFGTVYMNKINIWDNSTIPSPGYENQPYRVWNTATNAWNWIVDPQADILTYLQDSNYSGYFDTDWNFTDAATVLDGRNTPTAADPTVYKNGQRSRDITEYDYWLANRAGKVEGDNLIKAGSTPSCAMAPAQKAQILEISHAYQIGMLEDRYNLCKWWVDIPEMRKDNSVIQPMDELQVKIEILADDTGGLCATATTLCSCTVTLGVFGADKFTMYYPYVLTQSDPWTTGIAVTNVGTTFTSVDNMEAMFVLTDSTGAEFTYTKKDFESPVWTTMIDTLLEKFNATPAAGAGWLKVEANFPVDGYEFISDGVFGAGTQPRIFDNGRIRSSTVYNTD